MSDRLHPGYRKTTCSGCGNEKEANRADQRYCKECHRKSVAEYRALKREKNPTISTKGTVYKRKFQAPVYRWSAMQLNMQL